MDPKRRNITALSIEMELKKKKKEKKEEEKNATVSSIDL